MKKIEVGDEVTVYDISGWEGWVNVGDKYKVISFNVDETMITIDHPQIGGPLWIERFDPDYKKPSKPEKPSQYASDELWDCPV